MTSLFGSFMSARIASFVYDSCRKAANSWGSTEWPNVIVKTCAPRFAMTPASEGVAGRIETGFDDWPLIFATVQDRFVVMVVEYVGGMPILRRPEIMAQGFE